MNTVLLTGGASTKRPVALRHAAIAPPFDPNDPDGDVHTTLPPEQVIPPHFTNPVFMRADFNGANLLGDYTGNAPQDGFIRMTSGQWTGLRVPFLKGANSTPPTMLMTPMLALYPRDVQDADLTEHAQRGYDDFVISHEPWNAEENGRSFSIDDMVNWCGYVKETWGFRVVLWRGDRPPLDGPDPVTKALLDAKLVSFLIWGKEVNTKMSSEEYEQSIRAIDAYVKGTIPIGAHFSGDGRRALGYPQSAPDYLRDWSPWDGRVHLCQQLSPYAPDSSDELCLAGRQGSAMYYGRKRVNLGQDAGEGGLGPGAPNSRVIAFETMATAQLYDQCTEDYGCLREWELVCGTRNDPRVRPVSGFGNGCRYPDGNPI